MTITLTREEAQQVLDALEMYLTMSTYEEAKLLEVDIAPRAIETLRARLSAPEPVAWEYCGALFYNKEEVFAWHERGDISDTPPKPLYTAPPQREWQGLTDEEMFDCLAQTDGEAKRLPLGFKWFAEAIEAKLKEKNT